MTEPIQFDVPATCANLGPGFGVLAVALDLPLRITIERTDGSDHRIERRGTTSDMLLDSRHDFILRGLHESAERFGIKLPAGLSLIADSHIPPAAGLGSHTASCAAGIGAALRFAKKQPPRDDVLNFLVELGGDPGHGAAALVGNFTSVCQTTGPSEAPRFHIVNQLLHESWHFVIAIPETRVATADARRILPPTLPHAVTPRTASRLIGLLHTLASGDEDRLASFLFDEVHVPFRRRLAPGMEDAMAAGRQAGAAGVTISGHGPGLVALTTAGDAAKAIADAMAGAFRAAGQLADTACLRPVTTGALPAN